jgi:hypothetical protein
VFVWDTAWDSDAEAAEFLAVAATGLRGETRSAGSRVAVAVGPAGAVDLLVRCGRRVTMLRGVPRAELRTLRIALLDALE